MVRTSCVHLHLKHSKLECQVEVLCSRNKQSIESGKTGHKQFMCLYEDESPCEFMFSVPGVTALKMPCIILSV